MRSEWRETAPTEPGGYVLADAERELRNRSPVMGPVHWCEGCARAAVAFDWRKDRQLCAACERAGAS